MDLAEPKKTNEAKKKVRGKPFKKGQSGNPGGKLKGTRNAATLAAEALLDGESAALTRKAIELARKGDMAALRLVFARIVPPRQERPFQFDLPPLKKGSDAVAAIALITEGVSKGELTESEAKTLVDLVETFVTYHRQFENQLATDALRQKYHGSA
jgi:hypothetical protein